MDEYIWSAKYRPKKISETILPKLIGAQFSKFVELKSVPDLLLYGTSGIGKTTVARAMLEELNCDYLLINGSLDRGIDILRTDLTEFASSLSLKGTRKYIILDEADNLTPFSQAALRGFMEENTTNCGFIFTCNYPRKVIDALHSRCAVIQFIIPPDEKIQIGMAFLERLSVILNAEKIPFERRVLMELIHKYFPDLRRSLNELQRYSVTGKIDRGILTSVTESTYKELITAMRTHNFSIVRKWVGEHSDINAATLFREFYDNTYKLFTPDSLPKFIILLAEYQYKAAFVVDQEINLAAFLSEVMIGCPFNDLV